MYSLIAIHSAIILAHLEEIAGEIAIGVPITVAYQSRGLHRKCHEAWSKTQEFASKIAQKRREVIAGSKVFPPVRTWGEVTLTMAHPGPGTL
jgi:hypothetical protein